MIVANQKRLQDPPLAQPQFRLQSKNGKTLIICGRCGGRMLLEGHQVNCISCGHEEDYIGYDPAVVEGERLMEARILQDSTSRLTSFIHPLR